MPLLRSNFVLKLWICFETVSHVWSFARNVVPPPVGTARHSSTVASLDETRFVLPNINLPDFQDVFDKIQQVSPLARAVMDLPTQEVENKLQWKTIESNKNGAVSQIQKLEHFDGISTPLFRFRSQIKGPCIGEFFGRFIMDLNERRKWDAQIEQVCELHEIPETDVFSGDKYGKCVKLGLGYGQTKKAFGITPREQMFLYGLQDFEDGSSVIWGKELSEEYNHLLPQGPRHTRAKSHLFSATMKPREDGAFDIEYVLQLDIGGSMPTWLTTPVLIDTVKSLFRTAQQDFAGATDNLQRFLEEKAQNDAAFFRQHASLLFPH